MGISSVLETLSRGLNRSLEHLDLRGHRLGPSCLLPLSDLLASSYPTYCSLVSLDLSSCSLTDDHVSALCQGLVAATSSSSSASTQSPARPTYLTTALSDGMDHDPPFSGSTYRLHTLQTLLMKGIIGLGMKGMRPLSDVIKAPLSGLRTLDIGQCQVGGCVVSSLVSLVLLGFNR